MKSKQKSYYQIVKEFIIRDPVHILFILFAGLLFYKNWLMVNHSQFLTTYKYFTPDSYDWIVNALYYFKDDQISLRNPGLPLLISLLWSLNVFWLLPYLNSIAYLLLALFINKTVYSQIKDKLLSFFIFIAVVLNFDLYDFSKYILADIYAVLFLAVSLYFVLKKDLKLGFLFLGVSSLFQNFSYFILFIWLLVSFLEALKGDIGKVKEIRFLKETIISHFKLLIYFIIPNLPIYLFKVVKFNNPLHTNLGQTKLIDFNFDSILYYLVSSIDIFTIPILFMVGVAVVYYLAGKKIYEKRYLISALFVTLVFWVLIYDWNDKRFMLYVIPFIYVIAADGLSYLKGRLSSHKDLRGALFFLIFAVTIIHGTTPSTGFFVPNEIVVVPDLKLLIQSGYNDTEGTFLRPELSIQQVPYIDLYGRIPFIYEKRNTDILRGSGNFYLFYKEFIDYRVDKDLMEICIKNDEQVDFYSLRSILKIEEDLRLEDLEVVAHCTEI